jgi:P27 family predicted phage terminase small subunit
MGKRGPPPKPKAVKKAEGTFRKDRDPVDSMTAAVPAGCPEMPEGLNALAKARWMRVAPELMAAGVLAKVDGGALEAYCRSFARWSVLEEEAAKTPMMKTPFGKKMNPASAEARKLHKEVVQPLEIALGLHYAARSRVKAPEKAKTDPAADFLFKNKGPPDLKSIPGGRSPEVIDQRPAAEEAPAPDAAPA